MRLRRILPLAMLALVAPSTAFGFDPASGQATQAVQSPSLEQLLDFLVNERDVIGSATTNFDVEFERNFASGGGDKAEARFPGITEVIRTAGKQEMIAILHENYSALRATMAEILAQSLTQSEMEQANTFYGSPTGRKLVSAAVAGARGPDIGSLVSTAQDAAVGAMGPEDNEALAAFSRSDVFSKIAVLGAKLQQSSADWATSVMKGSAERLQNAVRTAGAAHVASLGSQPGK